MQSRIQRARTDLVSVFGQFLGQPRTVHVLLGCVMQDVQPHRSPLKLPHQQPPPSLLPIRYRMPISTARCAATGHHHEPSPGTGSTGIFRYRVIFEVKIGDGLQRLHPGRFAKRPRLPAAGQRRVSIAAVMTRIRTAASRILAEDLLDTIGSTSARRAAVGRWSSWCREHGWDVPTIHTSPGAPPTGLRHPGPLRFRDRPVHRPPRPERGGSWRR